ncbi:MAG: NAD-dependent epimerase/dehydratase family protein [Alphaproteobacteria bacterium]|nr:NAD-dependent epimerase/dehydratase family protein [Alphaproteobacteria bacterium]
MSAPHRILITGAGGFVGRWLVREFRSRHQTALEVPKLELHGLERTTSIVTETDHTHCADLLDQAAIEAVVAEVRPDVVIHLAAQAQVQQSHKAPNLTWDVNVTGTRIVAQAVKHFVPDCVFVFISSSEIYGGTFKTHSTPLDETALLDPRSPYALSKAAADLLIGQMAYDGLRAVRVRPFNHTGPGQDPAFVIPSFARQIALIEAGLQSPIVEVGNLDASRDFLDVRDVVRAYADIALCQKILQPGEIVNLASGTARRIGDNLKALLALSRVPISIKQDAQRMRPNDLPVTCGTYDKAKHLFDWSPRIEWAQTLSDILEDQRQALRRSL